MAIVRPTNPLGLIEDPFGGLPAYSQSRNMIPNRLRGLGFENALKTINYTISEHTYALTQDDASFRDHIKREIAHLLAEEAYKVAKYTQIRDPLTHNIRVIGRLVIMTEGQLNKLIDEIK